MYLNVIRGQLKLRVGILLEYFHTIATQSFIHDLIWRKMLLTQSEKKA